MTSRARKVGVGLAVAGGLVSPVSPAGSPVQPAGALTGRVLHFYNADVCNAYNLSFCLTTNTNNMTFGTLGRWSGYDPRWRAGSGDGSSTDRCRPNHGPIPHNTYTFIGHTHNDNSGKIMGRTWQVPNTDCDRFDPSSQDRTDLFIHTEETGSQGQSCPTSGDDAFCWEGDFDYISQGCIKVSYKNVGQVDQFWDSGSTSNAYLVVDA